MTPAPKRTQSLFRRSLTIFGVLAFLVLGTIGLRWGQSAEEPPSMAEELGIATALVVEKPFEHVVRTKGEVESRSNATLRSEVDERTTIISMVPAGIEVEAPLRSTTDGIVKTVRHPSRKKSIIVLQADGGEKITYEYEKLNTFSEVVVTPGEKVRKKQILAGDVVCRLDTSELEEDEQKYEIRVNDYRAMYEKAVKDVEIRETINESNNAQARLNADLAELDLKKYLEGTYPQQKEKLEGEIQSSKEDLMRARESLEFTERLATKGYKDTDDVEKARLKVLKLENTVGNQQRSQDVMENYTHERTLLQLREKALHLKRHAKRVQLAGEASMAQFVVTRSSRERVYMIYKRRLDWIRDQIKACTLVAPQAGKVIHASTGSSRSPQVLEEGSVVRERQKIIHLPDLNDMKVETRIHESLITQIREGQPATVYVDSLPDEPFECTLSELSTVPVPGRYPNYDRREYIAELKIEIPAHLKQKLRPGMNAEVEILVNQMDDAVTQVPMNAVVKAGQKHFVWTVFGDQFLRREITVGESNDEMFVVNDGLAVGDEVILDPYEQFSEEIVELRKQYPDQRETVIDWESEELAQEQQAPATEEEFFAMLGLDEELEESHTSTQKVSRDSETPASSTGD